jgi:hypothetical protein
MNVPMSDTGTAVDLTQVSQTQPGENASPVETAAIS